MSEFIQGHALLIGVGADLPSTVRDAKGIANLLENPERCAYPSSQVHLLTEAAASRSDILSALDQLAVTTSDDTTVIFYFSGHGYEVNTPIGKQYFLLPHGYDANDLLRTAIAGAELMAKLDAIKAQKMLILLDCCHAGGLDDAATKAPGVQFVKAPLPEEATSMLMKGRGRVIISSCKAHEKSYMGIPYSQFTQALLEAFAGADLSKTDGYVRAADLALYAAKTVPLHTENRQNPDLHFDQADNFVVAYYAAGDKQPKGLAPSDQRQAPSRDEREPIQSSNIFNQSGQRVHGNQTNVAGNVNTGGGAFIGGNVSTSGGDFVARDKVIQGDQIHGDKIEGDKIGGDKYDIGSISGGQVAIGRKAQVHVNRSSAPQLVDALQPILAVVRAATTVNHGEALQLAEQLRLEVAKGDGADDERVGDLIQDLVALVPTTAAPLVDVFGQPPLAEITGPATRYVLKRVGR